MGEPFLDRVANSRGGRWRSGTNDVQGPLVDSIRRNLARILNARQGMSQAQADYGLPSLSNLATDRKGLRQFMADAIRGVIIRYEPRLEAVRVICLGEDGQEAGAPWVFRIEGVIRVSRLSPGARVWYDVRPRGFGGFEVSD